VKRALLIGLIICVLAMGGIGAAFANQLGFTSIGALAMGWGQLPEISVEDVAWELHSGAGQPVDVDGVYLKFNQGIPANSVIFISLRNVGQGELAYYAGVGVGPYTAHTWHKFPLSDGTTATPQEVVYIKVTVAENSVYSADGQADIPSGPQ